MHQVILSTTVYFMLTASSAGDLASKQNYSA